MRKGLYFNLDCTQFFYVYRIDKHADGGAMLDAYADIFAEAGVAVLLINTNARRTNYASAVWEPFWEGYDPDGPDNQPFFAGLKAEEIQTYRPLIHSMWALHAQGVDYPARLMARCRARGISPWISLRMNDVHNNDNLAHPFHGTFFRDPQWHRGGRLSYFQRALDYAQPTVRDYYRALIVETLQRYDIDGLELDFMREPYLFREGAEAEGARLLCDWLREIRRLVRDAAAQRGHPIYLGVRVPSRIDVAQGWGLDAVRWAREGLVDLVVPTPRWATLEFTLPLQEWRRALAGTNVHLAGGLEILLRPCPDGPAQPVTPEHAVGAAVHVLSAGADSVYLFNYFPDIPWPRPVYLQTLCAMSSLETLLALPRRHAITYRDIIGPNEAYQPPLPATGRDLSFTLPTGPRPPAASDVRLEIRLAGPPPETAPAARVNEHDCSLATIQPADKETLCSYNVPVMALRDGDTNLIRLQAPQPITIKALELRIAPA